MFHSHFSEIQCNILNVIERSIAAMVARGNHLLYQKVLDQYVNCQGTFNFCSSHHDRVFISILYMIIGILQGYLLGPILKISIMRVLCRSVAPMTIQFMFKLVEMLFLQSLP